MGKARKKRPQKTNKPKINKHIDFLIFIDKNYLQDTNRCLKDFEDYEDQFRALFGGKVIDFIAYTSEIAMSRDIKDITEKISFCECLMIYSKEANPSSNMYHFITGIASAYNKPIMNINNIDIKNCLYLKTSFYDKLPIEYKIDNPDKFKIPHLQYELESKFLISEELYYRIYTKCRNRREDINITQYLDDDCVRNREIIQTMFDGTPIPECDPLYVKEIKSRFINGTTEYPKEVSLKCEFSVPVTLRQYVVKSKEFKRWHDYERPIKKHRITFAVDYNGNKYNVEFNKIKIATHSMYQMEIENIVPFKGINNQPYDEIDKSINDLVNYKEILKEFSNQFHTEINDNEYKIYTDEDGIKNTVIMKFIMEHKEKEYLDFIAFKNKCNAICKDSVIKNSKSLFLQQHQK